MNAPPPQADKAQDLPIPVTAFQLASLKQCVEQTIESYRVKRRRNKIGAVTLQIFTVALSVGTTVLIGWQLQQADESALRSVISNFALVVSALATGATALDKFFDYKPLWIGYNVAIADLKGILNRLAYLQSVSPEQLKQQQVEELYTRYESICSDMVKSYREIRAAKDE